MSFRTTNGREKSLVWSLKPDGSRGKGYFQDKYWPMTAHLSATQEGFLPSVEMTWREWALLTHSVPTNLHFLVKMRIAANSMNFEEILAEYPDLKREDIQEALRYAACVC